MRFFNEEHFLSRVLARIYNYTQLPTERWLGTADVDEDQETCHVPFTNLAKCFSELTAECENEATDATQQ